MTRNLFLQEQLGSSFFCANSRLKQFRIPTILGFSSFIISWSDHRFLAWLANSTSFGYFLGVSLPIHRRVLRYCNSGFLILSAVFAVNSAARLPVAPLGVLMSMRHYSLYVTTRQIVSLVAKLYNASEHRLIHTLVAGYFRFGRQPLYAASAYHKRLLPFMICRSLFDLR